MPNGNRTMQSSPSLSREKWPLVIRWPVIWFTTANGIMHSVFIWISAGLMACHPPQPKNKVNQDSSTSVHDSSAPQAPTTEPATEPSAEPSSEPATEPAGEPACEAIHGEGEPLATVNDCNTLSYGLYPAHNETEAHLPGLFTCRLHGGGIGPSVPAVLTVEAEQETIMPKSKMPLTPSAAKHRTPTGTRNTLASGRQLHPFRRPQHQRQWCGHPWRRTRTGRHCAQ